jgi:hypothetical protein
MTNFERKKKNGALDALRSHRTRILAGIFAVIGSYPAGRMFGVASRRRPLRKMSAIDRGLF